ncbi:MAG: hypothetical protein QMC46_07350 [Burkholderiaceae bacterium]
MSYVAYEKEGTASATIDSVHGYDPKAGHTQTASADKLNAFVQEKTASRLDFRNPRSCRYPVSRTLPA